MCKEIICIKSLRGRAYKILKEIYIKKRAGHDRINRVNTGSEMNFLVETGLQQRN
jgi:hypothetical protein